MDQITGDVHQSNEIVAEEKQPSSSSKPVIERRRRARINEYLSQLKLLLMDDICDKPGRLSRIDKAELLELAVNHVQKHRTMEGVKPFDTYQAGFNECLWSLNSMLSGQEDENTQLRLRVQEHMAAYLHQRKETRHEMDYLNLPRNTGYNKQLENIRMGQLNYQTENMTRHFQGQQSSAQGQGFNQGHGVNIIHPTPNLYSVPPHGKIEGDMTDGKDLFYRNLHNVTPKHMSQTFTPTPPHGISQNNARNKQHEVKKPMALKLSATCTSSATGWRTTETGNDVIKPKCQVRSDHSSSPFHAELNRSQSYPHVAHSGGSSGQSFLPNYESSKINRCIFETPTNKKEKSVSRISRSQPLSGHMNFIKRQVQNKPASVEILNTPIRREPGLETQNFTPIQRGTVLPPFDSMPKLFTPEETHKRSIESSNKYTPIILHDGTVINTPSHLHHQVARKLLPTDQSERLRSHPYMKR